VREKYQRQHIGGQLINWCKESALKRGMKRIRLEVLDSNEKAIRFYEKEGFIFEKKCSENSRYMIFEITAAL
jgi:ribosomal protein S18 acetylase RimI-like enzyme